MTEPGNTFEPQQNAGSEETENTVLTDATANTGGDQPTGESTAAPESAAPSAEDAAPQQSEASNTPAEADAPAAEQAGEGSAPAEATTPAPQELTSDAAEPSDAAAAVAPVETGQAEGESPEGEDHGEEGGETRRRGGRQLPKMPEEQMRELWSELAAKKNAGTEIELEVISTNRGGVVAQYNGVEVFVPISHWSLDRHNTEGVSSVSPGDKFHAHVLEITSFDTDARRVTATRRTLLRRDLLGSLEVGQRLHGRVASILDFGAFVDLGGVDGLVHASEISYDRTRRPSELLNKGDEVEVVIREIDREKKRIYLGMKELQASPWEGIEERYPIGTVQQGRVVGIGKNGAFIEMEPGLEGFVRVSELSWTRRVNNPKEILKKGMDIEVKVLDSSSRKQRLSLSFRQAQEDPWQGLATKFSVGTSWEGEIREISNKGVVVAIEEVEGFLPRGRMGREARRLPDMKVGEKLGVHVIEVDPNTHSLIFGLAGQENEGGGDRPERNERSGGGGGGGGDRGERRGGGGGGRDRGDRDRDRGDRGDRGRVGSVVAVNEMKSADTVTSFALGDIINDAIKKALNYSEPEPPKEQQQPKPKAAPVAPAAPAAAPAPPAPAEPSVSPAQEAAPAGAESAEAADGPVADAETQTLGAIEGEATNTNASSDAEGGQTFPTSFEDNTDSREASDEERPV